MFSWLHFSDLHFDVSDYFDVELMRDKLLEFLPTLPQSDYIFLTGDLANKGIFNNVKRSISKIIKAANVPDDDKERFYWAVGNHDIKRRDSGIRKYIIDYIRNSACPEEVFQKMIRDKEIKPYLTSRGISQYLEKYKDITGFELKEDQKTGIHRMLELEDLNLIILNTCLTSNDKSDEGALFVLEPDLLSVFTGLDEAKPTIVIGHHGIDFLHKSQRTGFENLLDNKADIYLCGHSHVIGVCSYDRTHNDIHEITCGFDKENKKYSFMRGELLKDDVGYYFSITPYSFKSEINDWKEDFDLHSKLYEDNKFYLTRLSDKKKMVTVKQTSYWEKSRAFYDFLLSKDGRFSYIKYEEELFAGACFELPLKCEKGKIESIPQIIDNETENMLLVGEGGSGKTTSLLKCWKNFLDNKKRLPIYVLLNDSNDVAQKEFIDYYIKKEYGFALDDYQGDVILLLDGFNEIMRDPSDIVKEIKRFGLQERTQVIIVSRGDFRKRYGMSSYKKYNLQPLKRDIVEKYLSKNHFTVIENMLPLLQNPMLLSIYTQTERLKSVLTDRVTLKFWIRCGDKRIHTKGDLLYDYFLCQLGMSIIQGNLKSFTDDLLILFGISPFVSFCLEKRGRFEIRNDELDKYIGSFFSDQRDVIELLMKNLFREIYRENYIPEKGLEDEIYYCRLLVNKYHIFIKEENRYVLRHQYIRDFFSAIHIFNKMRAAISISKNWESIEVLSDTFFPQYLCEMLADVLAGNNLAVNKDRMWELKYLLEQMRGCSIKKENYALINVVNIWKTMDHGQIIGADLSDMDLRNIQLNCIRFSDLNQHTVFDKSKLSYYSLMPTGHSCRVFRVCINQSGTRLISVSVDNTIKAWESYTGKLLGSLRMEATVQDVTFGNDGRTIILGLENGEVRAWENMNSAETVICYKHKTSVRHICCNPILHTIMSVSDSEIYRWSEKQNDVKYQGPVCCEIAEMHISPSGKYFTTLSVEGGIELWGETAGKQENNFYCDLGKVTSICYGKNDESFAIVIEQQILIIQIDGNVTKRKNDNKIKTIKYNGKGNYYITVHTNNTMKIWSEVGEELFSEHTKGVNVSCVYCKDKEWFVTGAEDGSVTIWDGDTCVPVNVLIGYDASINCMTYIKDRRCIITGSKSVKIWDETEGILKITFSTGNTKVVDVAYSSYDDSLTAVLVNGRYKCWKLSTGSVISEGALDIENILKINCSPDGRTMALLNNNTVQLKYIGKDENIYYRNVNGYMFTDLSYHPEGNCFIMSSDGMILKCIISGEKMYKVNLIQEKKRYTAVCYAPSGEYVVTASSCGEIKMWYADTGELYKYCGNHVGVVMSIAFGTKGEYFVTAAADGSIKSWNGLTGEFVKAYCGHTAAVTGISFFSTDGFITASADKTIKKWSINEECYVNEIENTCGIYLSNCTFYNALFETKDLKRIIKSNGGIV